MGQNKSAPVKTTAQQIRTIQKDKEDPDYDTVTRGLDAQIADKPFQTEWCYRHESWNQALTLPDQQLLFENEYKQRGFEVDPVPLAWTRNSHAMPPTASQFHAGVRMNSLFVCVRLPSSR
jgi:hypothetical protein